MKFSENFSGLNCKTKHQFILTKVGISLTNQKVAVSLTNRLIYGYKTSAIVRKEWNLYGTIQSYDS